MLRLHQRGRDARFGHGGTGFVGSHTVAALVNGGHQVRLLIRDRQRVAPAVAPLGLQPGELDTIVGDVIDPAVVDQAVRDCEAVVHAGSVYSLDRWLAEQGHLSRRQAGKLVAA
jgi:nucleoside-diphosphate-sugar epimerase